MTGLNGMTFETDSRPLGPACPDHGPDCIGHAMRIGDDS